MHLTAKLVSGEEVVIEVPEGLSLEEARDQLLGREGQFAGNWVEVRTKGKASRHVRYDHVVEVNAHR